MIKYVFIYLWFNRESIFMVNRNYSISNFRSINITHGYTCKYQIGSFTSDQTFTSIDGDDFGYVEDKLTLVRPVNGKQYDSYIMNQYFDVRIDGPQAPDEAAAAAIHAIKLIPERVKWEDTGIPIYDIYIKDLKEEDNYNEKRLLINPKIIQKEGLTEYWEACASCLDNIGKVLRPYKITIEYYDIEGHKQRSKFIGFESTVLFLSVITRTITGSLAPISFNATNLI